MAVFRVGKIKSKYLILEILSYAHFDFKAVGYFFHSSSNLRALILQNPHIAMKILAKAETLVLNLPHENSMFLNDYVRGCKLHLKILSSLPGHLELLRELARGDVYLFKVTISLGEFGNDEIMALDGLGFKKMEIQYSSKN